MFCMHSVNLHSNASFIDKVSPYEQFSGLKLDAKRNLRVGFGDYAVATNATTDNSMGSRAGQFIALGDKQGRSRGQRLDVQSPLKPNVNARPICKFTHSGRFLFKR
jgi:hypothetical protein